MTLTPEEWVAVKLSLQVASLATLLCLPLAVLVAWALSRDRLPGKLVLESLVLLPLVLPPVVTGYVLLILCGRRGPVGAALEHWFGIVLSFRWTGAALAAAVMGFPMMVQAIRLSFQSTDPRLAQAASTLGASPLWVFLTVTLPLGLPGLLTGSLLCFAKALGEFGATITFVSNIPGETQTIPSAIYGAMQVPGGDASVIRLSLISVCISFAALVISALITSRAVTARGLRT
jgi:molybdate transport system permease protein